MDDRSSNLFYLLLTNTCVVSDKCMCPWHTGSSLDRVRKHVTEREIVVYMLGIHESTSQRRKLWEMRNAALL